MSADGRREAVRRGHVAAIWAAVYGVIVWTVIIVATGFGGYPGFGIPFMFRLTASMVVIVSAVAAVRYKIAIIQYARGQS